MEAGLYSSNWVSARASRPACTLICQGRARPLAGCTRVASAYTWLHALCNSTAPVRLPAFPPAHLPARQAGDVYIGARLSVLSVLYLIFLATPLLGLLFAYMTYGV